MRASVSSTGRRRVRRPLPWRPSSLTGGLASGRNRPWFRPNAERPCARPNPRSRRRLPKAPRRRARRNAARPRDRRTNGKARRQGRGHARRSRRPPPERRFGSTVNHAHARTPCLTQPSDVTNSAGPHLNPPPVRCAANRSAHPRGQSARRARRSIGTRRRSLRGRACLRDRRKPCPRPR